MLYFEWICTWTVEWVRSCVSSLTPGIFRSKVGLLGFATWRRVCLGGFVEYASGSYICLITSYNSPTGPQHSFGGFRGIPTAQCINCLIVQMYSSSLFQFYETRQRKLWKWWHIYKQHVILICWSALVAGNEQPLQTSMALSYGKIQRFKNTKVSITKVNIKVNTQVKITLGEPDWKPSLEHSESIRFPTFQRQTRVSIYSNDCKGSLLSHCFHCNSSKKKNTSMSLFPRF